jgi:hypothetical protein
MYSDFEKAFRTSLSKKFPQLQGGFCKGTIAKFKTEFSSFLSAGRL